MSESEKRRRPRTPLSGGLDIMTGSGQRVQAQAVDFSLLGFRFSAEELLTVGEAVSTTIKFPSGKTHTVEGVIRFITAGAPYQYGVAFSQGTTERVIKDLIKVV